MNLVNVRNRLIGYAGAVVLAAAAAAVPASAAYATGELQMERLPVPAGVVNSEVTGGDHTGRFLVGAGARYVGTQRTEVVLSWEDGAVSELDTAALAPYADVYANDINKDGAIVGRLIRDYSTFRIDAWIYRDGSFTLLPGLDPTHDTVATAINARGDVVGRSGPRPVRWPADQPGTVRELAVDPSLPSPAWAADIDDDGTVLGHLGCRTCDGERPYIWTADGAGYELAAPAGATHAEGIAIHNGWVAGTAAVGYSGAAVRWDLSAGTATVISTEHGSATAVNSRGTVAASDALLYRDGGVQALDGYVRVLTDRGTAAGTDAPYLSGNAVIWS